ncbi:MAG: HEAT repeat domain-containing protein [Planctomycetota bacterium]
MIQVLTLAALCLALAARPAQPQDSDPRLPAWSWPTTPEHLVIAQALRESRHADAAPGAELVQRMLGAGPGAPAAAIDLLARRRVPETSPEDAPQVLSAPQRDLVLALLSRASESQVRAEIRARLELDPLEAGARLAAIHALGAVGRGADLVRIVELAPRRDDEGETLTKESRETVRSACASILRKDVRAWFALTELVRKVDSEAGRALLGAIATQREPRALSVLFSAALWQSDLGPQAAALATTCGGSSDPQLDSDFTAWIVSELPDARPEYARSLLQALGTIDDGTNVKTLIEHLKDEDAGSRDSALWGLRRLSGLGFPADPVTWRAWIQSEDTWHKQRRPRLRFELDSNDVSRVAAALREYSERRTRRPELAREVTVLLRHPQRELRLLACIVLEHLGSSAACDELSERLRDPDADVKEAAWKALCSITGLTLPRDPDSALGILRAS